MAEIWNVEQNMKFINLFRDYPLIWDQSLEEYKHTSKKDKAFGEIAKQMGTTKNMARRKLHSFRTNYCAELRKMLMRKGHKPKWKYFDALKFMFKHEGDTFGDPLCDINRSFVTQSFRDVRSSMLEYNNDDNADDDGHNDNMAASHYCGMDQTEYGSNQSQDLTENSQFSAEEVRDEFSVFGDHVANELRLLSDYKSIQLALKCKIMRALLEANEAIHRNNWNISD